MEPKTVDIIALLTRTYGVSEQEALEMMQRVLRERGKQWTTQKTLSSTQ